MTVIEMGTVRDELTFRQRWSHYFALIFGAVGLFVGLNLRDSVLSATTLYTNPQAGITAEYPRNWLLEEGGSAYVFRVRDISHRGYKTTLQVTTRPVSAQTTARNIFDTLTLSRAQVLAAYNVISEEPITLPDETETTAMRYTFVATEVDPFLQTVPIVVEGIDILVVARGQAIVISFLSSADQFEENSAILEQFLRSLIF
jgi:hypothetical protein